MRTIKTLIDQGNAVRGVKVRLSGTNYVAIVDCVIDEYVYLIGEDGVYAPQNLIVED